MKGHLFFTMGAFATALLSFSPSAEASLAGVNFSGNAALPAEQRLASTEAAGFISQKFWNDAPSVSGQVGVEADGGTSIPVFYSGFTAHWQGAAMGSASGSSLLPNAKLMRGSLLSSAGSSVLVQFSGIPVFYTSGGYALVVYSDVPGNDSDIVMKATLQAGATVRTLYLRDAAESGFSGSFARAAFTATADSGANTPAGNIFIFTGLNAGDLAVSIEPAESNPEAVVAVNAIQIVPLSQLPQFAPRITSDLEVSATQGESFSYQVQTDISATSYQASGLPAGLSINTSTGLISGTPTVTGTFPVLLKAINGAGESAATFVLTIDGSGQTGLRLYMVPAIVVQGSIGETHLVEFANEFEEPATWTPIGTVVLTNQAQFYIDLSATNRARRFYRTRLQ